MTLTGEKNGWICTHFQKKGKGERERERTNGLLHLIEDGLPLMPKVNEDKHRKGKRERTTQRTNRYKNIGKDQGNSRFINSIFYKLSSADEGRRSPSNHKRIEGVRH